MAGITSASVLPGGASLVVASDELITALSLGQIRTAQVLGASGTSAWSLPGGTVNVPIGATPDAVKTLLEAVVGSGNVTVAGFNPYRLTFASAQASFSVNTAGLSSTRSTDPTTAGTTALSEAAVASFVGSWSRSFGSYITGQIWTNSGNGDSTSYAKITKTGLSPGNYKLYTGWAGGAGYATNVKYRIYDGSTLVNVVQVNQTAPIVDGNGVPAGYAYVKSAFLCNVYTSTGTINVYVCDDCNGSVDVSGVVVEPYAPSVANTPYSQSVSQSTVLVGSPSYTVNGGGSTALSGPPLWSVAGDQKYAVFLLGQTLSPSDVVSVFLPAGSVTTTSGAIAATTLTATNVVGGKLLPAFDPTATRTFKLGWNVGCPSYADVFKVYSNLMRACPKLYPIGGLTAPTFDGNGNVVSGSAGGILRTGSANVLDSQGYRNEPAGTYTVKFTGAGDVILLDNASNRQDLGTIGGYRTITYDVPAVAGTVNVDLHIRIDGPAYNVAVYPPGADTSAPSAFWPAYLTQIQGAYALRTMTWFGGIYNSILDAADFTPDTQVSWADNDTFKSTYTITSIAAYGNGDNFYPSGYAPALFTLSAPHDMVEMTSIQLLSNDGVGGSINVPVSGGGTVNINNYTYQIHYNPATMTTSQFAVGIQYTGSVSGTVSSPNATCSRSRRYCPPLSSIVSLCNQVGAHLWLNIPPVAPGTRPNAAWTTAFDYIAANLNSNLHLFVEFANEPWNFAFPPFHYLTALANSLGTTLMGAYANYAAQWHSLGRARWIAGGRDAANYHRVFGTFTGTPSFTQDLVTYCQAHSIPIDYLALAPYWYLQPDLNVGLDAAYNALTDAQVADVAEAYQMYGLDVVRQNVSVHRGYLDAGGYTSAKICNYEQATAYGRLGGTATNQAKHSQGLHKNPRLKNILLNEFKALQDQGTEFGCWYTAHGGYAAEGGAAGTSMYAAYMGCDMLAGNGDGSDGKNDNRVAPYTVAGSVSVVGQAVLDWNAPAKVVRRWVRRVWRWRRGG